MEGLAALGELIGFALIGLLCTPIILVLIFMILNGKKFFKRGMRYLLYLLILPAFIVLSVRFTPERNLEFNYAGTYYLNQYPYCDACVLNLKENNVYIVTKKGYQIEKGTWKYLKDSYSVQIGTDGQLGDGDYKYIERQLLQYH
ncbi:MAG: hypothetical protein AAF611_09870 [Bacteroidota bacterium]